MLHAFVDLLIFLQAGQAGKQAFILNVREKFITIANMQVLKSITRKSTKKMKKPFTYLLVLCILCIAIINLASIPVFDDHTESQLIQSDSLTGWRQLFNGKDLTGWKHVGNGYMTVDDGIIQTHGGMGLLYWT